jgi:pimeloyl-ACP methyl ester carboxylesterase
MMTRSRKFAASAALFILTASFSVVRAFGQANAQGVQESVVKLSASNIEYFSEGQGEAVVLLPGGSLTVGYIDGPSQALADAGYRAVRINFRGSGKSTGSGEAVTLHTLAADVAGVIQALKLRQANVVGHAFGNRAARMVAADHPELVHSVILYAAGGKVPPKPPAEQALMSIFNPASTYTEVLAAMRYMVGPADNVEAVWQILKPCRAPEAAGIERTAAKTFHSRIGGHRRERLNILCCRELATRPRLQKTESC